MIKSIGGFFMKNCKNKDCTQNNPQPLDNFFNDKGFKSGKMSICKVCKQAKTLAWRSTKKPVYNDYMKKWRAKNPDKQHATDIKRNYGLSLEDYNKMLAQQNLKCALCDRQHDPSIKRGRLYVDHDHSTGKVRALLCGAHNSMLGYAEDSIEVLEKAINYLKKYQK
jgi:hypothetical protein